MRFPWSALFLLLIVSASLALADKPDETALQTLWTARQKTPANSPHPTQRAQDAIAFEQHFPASPLVPVARGLAAWDLLESGDLEGAKRILEKMTSSETADPVSSIGAEMARRWLTRLDREQVAVALQKGYAEDLEYPVTLSVLDALPSGTRPPMTDRWDAPWTYSPDAFKKLQTGYRQTFILESSKLGATSPLKTALALPYGAGFTFTPAMVMPSISDKMVILFKSDDGRTDTLSQGAAASDLAFAYLGDEILILSSGDYWSIQPRPSSH